MFDGGDCCRILARGNNNERDHLGGKTTQFKKESERIQLNLPLNLFTGHRWSL